MSRRQQFEFRLLLLVWGATVALFWRWWLDPSHVDGGLRFVLNSLVLSWPFLLASYFFYFVLRMKRPNPDLAIPDGLQVAMITTKTPNEAFAIVRHTLSAMLAQQYPHDTWLADEDPSPETIAWCAEHGVRVSTRRDAEAYHRSTWPRRTRCKEGNLAYFYDTYGYDSYDVVVQLDADHAPAAGYLEEMLRPFADRAVGYVSAPSVCSANTGDSWTARARLNAEGSLHGALQAGYSAGWAPLCIGSHYAVRTAALREIGGLGPELAEDHSTTLLMNAQGWRGVHAFEATAHGYGPASFTDCMTQEYQWARSLATILLTLTPHHWMRLPARLKLQFVFSQLWYLLFGLVMLAGHLMPTVALLAKRPWANVDYVAFICFAAPVTITTLAIVSWLKRQGWFRPLHSSPLCWETVLFQYVRWPWVLLGALTAALDVVRHTTTEFRVTPKGRDLAWALPVRVLAPYALLVVVPASVTILTPDAGNAAGYLYLAIIDSMIYAAVIGIVIFRHVVESIGRRVRDIRPTAAFSALRRNSAPLALLLLVTVFPIVAILVRGEDAADSIVYRHISTLYPAAYDLGLCHDSTVLTRYICGVNPYRLGINYGIYDPDRSFASAQGFAFEHIYVQWDTYESSIPDRSEYAKARGRWLLLTVEPFAHSNLEASAEQLFRDILAGSYDQNIERICGDIQQTNHPTFVRWGHEMENLTGRYPWAQADYIGYAAAYRHFVDRCRAQAQNTYYVWSPVGNAGLHRYWPGPHYADYVGLSVYGFPQWDVRHYGRPRSFEEIFSEKYELVKGFGKPVLIAELGVTGDQEYQWEWMYGLFRSVQRFPLLKSVVYFNARDSELAWGRDYEIPDWRIDRRLFR